MLLCAIFFLIFVFVQLSFLRFEQIIQIPHFLKEDYYDNKKS